MLQKLKAVVPEDSITLVVNNSVKIPENGTVLFAIFPNQLSRLVNRELKVNCTSEGYSTLRDFIYGVQFTPSLNEEVGLAQGESLLQALRTVSVLDIADGCGSGLYVVKRIIQALGRLPLYSLSKLFSGTPDSWFFLHELQDFVKLFRFKFYAHEVLHLQKFRPLIREWDWLDLFRNYAGIEGHKEAFMAYSGRLGDTIAYNHGDRAQQIFGFTPCLLQDTDICTFGVPDLIAWKRKDIFLGQDNRDFIGAEELVEDLKNLMPLAAVRSLTCYFYSLLKDVEIRPKFRYNHTLTRILAQCAYKAYRDVNRAFR